MAIYRLHLKHITRDEGFSAHAHARYITRNADRSASFDTPERATERERSASSHAAYLDRTGTSARGTSRDDLVHVEHGNMPRWAQDKPQTFWHAADAYERANGRLYSEMEVAIPRELAPQDRVSVVQDFVQHEIGERHPYTFAIHNSQARDEGEQPHAHIMFSTRTLDGIERAPAQFFARANRQDPERGGAVKDRTWYAKSTLGDLRRDWADITNRALERAGLDMRIDHRSLAEQGIDRTPEPKMGKEQTAMWQRGQETDITREVQALRAQRERIARVDRALTTTTRELEAVEGAERARQSRRHERGEELVRRARDPAAARERLSAHRAARLEHGRDALEQASGVQHAFATTARVTGTVIDKVEVAGRDYARLQQTQGSMELVPWTDDFSTLMGRAVHVLLSTEVPGPRRVRLIRLLSREHEREQMAGGI